MKENDFKKPDYYGDEDSPIIGMVEQDLFPHYRIRDLDRYIKSEAAKGRTVDDLTKEELEQFRVK